MCTLVIILLNLAALRAMIKRVLAKLAVGFKYDSVPPCWRILALITKAENGTFLLSCSTW